jgi:integrase
MARRRDPGEGTLYYSTTHAYWEGQLPPELRNTPGVKNFVRHKDKKQAKELLNTRIAEAKAVRASRVRTPDKYTVQQCVADWIAREEKTGKKDAQTISNYKGYARNWINPYIGHLVLATEVTPRVLVEFFDGIAPSLGSSALTNIRSVLRRATDHAQIDLLISHNDARLVRDLPEPGVCPRPKGAMDHADVKKVIASVTGTRYRALMAVSIYMGLRPGELIKLRWDHVDLDNRELHIWRSTSKGDATKTPQSKRSMRIADKAYGPLKEWRDMQQDERAAAGPAWHDNDLVFCYEDGRPYTIHNLRYRYLVLTRDAGVGTLPPYKGRHTFASVLFNSGLSTERIAPLMGHKNSSVTEEVYVHLIRPVLNDAADAIDAAFGDD